MANILQLKYSEIGLIVKEMQAEQQQMQEIYRKTKAMSDQMTGDTWQGDAAVKFHSEMDDLYLKKLFKVGEALGKSAEIAMKISNSIREADLSTKSFFKFE